MVKSADRVIRILEKVGQNKNGLRHTEISKALSIPKSSLTALLSSLVSKAYLSVIPAENRYVLGPQILALAGYYQAANDILKISQPIIRNLMQVTSESASLTVSRGTEVMIVCKEDCPNPLKHQLDLGQRGPMYATAGGKIFLAYLSSKELDEYFSSVELIPFTKHTNLDPEKSKHELIEVRKTNIAYNREEHEIGIIAMSTPVYDLYGKLVASVGVPMPIIRFTPEKEQFIKKELLSSAEMISYKLGFNSNKN